MPAKRYHIRERAALKAGFLKAIISGRTVRQAAAEIGMQAPTLYYWRGNDKAFAARWDEAMKNKGVTATDPLEAEAERRAIVGIEKPVYRAGKLVGHTREFSDSMLMFLLKARYPEKYDRRTAERGDGDTPNGAIEGARDALISKLDPQA